MIVDEAGARAWLHARSECDDVARARLDHLTTILAVANHAQNLVSAASLPHVWRRHIADSAQLLDHVPRGTSPWLDVGSGAGFPGLVLAILRVDVEIVLIESRPLRSAWLRHAATALELANVQVLAQRIEVSDAPTAGAISARAFAPLLRTIALCAGFSTPKTRWALPKGRSAAQELTTLRGWSHMFHVEPSITDPAAGIIVGRLLGTWETRG